MAEQAGLNKVSFVWPFESEHLMQSVLNCKLDGCITSDRFEVANCTFYLECTPNGYSSNGFDAGYVGIWLAFERLHDDLDSIEVLYTISCPELNFHFKRGPSKLGGIHGGAYSLRPLKIFKLDKLRDLCETGWQFKCDLEITNFYKSYLNKLPFKYTNEWRYDTRDIVEQFKQCDENGVIHSEKFVIDPECPEFQFYIECTPNGYYNDAKKGTLYL